MRFVEIGDKFLNLDNVTDVSISVDRIGIKRMAVRFRDRRTVRFLVNNKGSPVHSQDLRRCLCRCPHGRCQKEIEIRAHLFLRGSR